ncbi:hypothetical protein LJY25_14450 [Hymenobacter sp. BT175]|uniref:hypothetical protein n=1 Tax=Hymenobacter translucens TaxID=2886507 RepID=UPI001D0E8EAF|nr:hypothetical protein [Hymenobacter translucens]MCC2547652.1 hypothetical protein [Hymenobacter translucens]
MAASPLTDQLTATINALRGGLTAIPISAAMDTTEAWQQHFLQSGVPDQQDIAREIGNLQTLLSAETLDGAAIGRSLSMLGSQTLQLAQGSEGDVQSNLRTLGDLLLRIGSDLDK